MEEEIINPTDVKEWQIAITRQLKEFKEKWWDKADKVIDRYKDKRNLQGDNRKRFNILWSNVETLKPALYANPPKPEIGRRFKDKDPVGRQASMVLERAISYAIDAYDFDGEIKSDVEDYLLPGRATARVRYKPTYGEEVTPKNRLLAIEEGFYDAEGNAYGEEQITFDEQGPFIPGEPYEPVLYEEAVCEYVYWKDFIHGPAKRWNDVPWVGFRATMTRDELIERFGPTIGTKIKLDCSYKKDDDDEYEKDDMASIWEIWDKKRRKVIWVSLYYKDSVLDESDPPLNLHGFFPCPKPLFSVKTNDSMMPIPEYCMYQDQADEIDSLTARISILIKAVRVAGAYPGSQKDTLQQILMESGDNTLVPVDNWAMFAERGGLNGMISWVPIDQIVSTIVQLYQAREQTKQELYEITGIADLLRGASDPNATATAERIKGQFATLRISDRQEAVSEFIRDLLRLKAEVMCEHFEAQTLQMMTGLTVDDQVMQLLRNDALRTFRIDIETDSTLRADEEMDKRSRIEFLEAITNFLQTLLPMAQEVPELGPLFGQMILFGVRGFKAGRQLEEQIEQALELLEQKAQQAQQQPPQPDPKQIESQAKAQKIQQDMQLDQAKFQNQTQLDKAKLQHESQIKEAEFGLKQQEVEQDMEIQRIKARLGQL